MLVVPLAGTPGMGHYYEGLAERSRQRRKLAQECPHHMYGIDVWADPRRDLARHTSPRVRKYRVEQKDTSTYDGADDYGIFEIYYAAQSESESDVHAMARR